MSLQTSYSASTHATGHRTFTISFVLLACLLVWKVGVSVALMQDRPAPSTGLVASIQGAADLFGRHGLDLLILFVLAACNSMRKIGSWSLGFAKTFRTWLGCEIAAHIESCACLNACDQLVPLILGRWRQELRGLGLVVFGHECGVVALANSGPLRREFFFALGRRTVMKSVPTVGTSTPWRFR